jgi:hypothetical protein
MRLINHASGFNRYVANSLVLAHWAVVTLGGRYPHHVEDRYEKDQTPDGWFPHADYSMYSTLQLRE